MQLLTFTDNQVKQQQGSRQQQPSAHNHTTPNSLAQTKYKPGTNELYESKAHHISVGTGTVWVGKRANKM